MLIRAGESRTERVENLKGGAGVVEKRLCLETLPEGAKMFAELTLAPGCSIGLHKHTGEYETFFCTRGELTLDDGGEEKLMHTGDFAICPDGGTHALSNRSDAPASVFACIIKTAL